MVDLPTVHSVTKRLVAGSRLLLVGDEAQLPPIGFGLVFHKLVKDPSTTLRLTQVHRQAAATGIPQAAATVRSGGVPVFSEFAGPASGISFVDADPAGIAPALDGVIAQLGEPRDVLVVTATIAGAAGVESINERFHRRYVTAGHAELPGFFGRRFSVDEPVIFERNDYRAGLFNGLLGHVTAIDLAEHTVEVLFDGDAEPKTLGDEHLVDLISARDRAQSASSSLSIPVGCSTARGPTPPLPAPNSRSSSSVTAASSAPPWRSLPLLNSGQRACYGRNPEKLLGLPGILLD